MGNTKDNSYKSLQKLSDDSENASTKLGAKSSKHSHQILLQQSVTLLALKDKVLTNVTLAPDVIPPKLFFGFVEDVPLLIGAVIGASLIIAFCVLILTFWKCCPRMTVWSKKKQYCLQPKDNTSTKGKYKFPVQSNSVVFLGLRPAAGLDCKTDRSTENCLITNFASNSANNIFEATFDNPLNNCIMSSECPEIIVSNADRSDYLKHSNLSRTASCNSGSQTCSVISVSPVLLNRTLTSCTNSSIVSSNDGNIPNIIVHHRDSPALLTRNFYSGNFEQHSLYSCGSRTGSDVDLKKLRFTWSNYSLRPTSGNDGYYDLFQKANFCKKRKNRMRSDIAAAIALNRSQSPQLSQDTELLVDNAVEVISNERTTL